MYPDIYPICDRCKQAPALLIHIFTIIGPISDMLSVVLQVPFDPVALTALVGVIPDTVVLPRLKADLVVFLTLLARPVVLKLVILRTTSENICLPK